MSIEMSPRQWFGTFLMCAAIALIIVGQIACRIANPDASETRLFLDYWWLWASAFLLALVGISITQEKT
jgi:hypothetical protein